MRLAICMIVLLAAGPASAQQAAIGMASLVRGDVKIEHAGEKGKWLALRPGGDVFLGDTIRTESGSAKITFVDQSVISLSPRSKVELNEFVYRPKTQRKTLFKLWGGRVKASISKFFAASNDVRVSTPTAVAGVRGTDFEVTLEGQASAEDWVANPDGGQDLEDRLTTEVVVFDGEVGVSSSFEKARRELRLKRGDLTKLAFGRQLGDVEKLGADVLRSRQVASVVRSRGSLRSTIGSSQFEQAKSSVGPDRSLQLSPRSQMGAPPIDQQPTDVKQGSSLTIKVRIQGQ